MKRVQGQSTENAFNLAFEVLSNEEMTMLKGGIEPPKSRDKDVFDLEEN